MSDNVYTAEKILSKRRHRGVTQFLIKWKGYSMKECTWEPIRNILDKDLLTSFESDKKSPKKLKTSHPQQKSSLTSKHGPPKVQSPAQQQLVIKQSPPPNSSADRAQQQPLTRRSPTPGSNTDEGQQQPMIRQSLTPNSNIGNGQQQPIIRQTPTPDSTTDKGCYHMQQHQQQQQQQQQQPMIATTPPTPSANIDKGQQQSIKRQTSTPPNSNTDRTQQHEHHHPHGNGAEATKSHERVNAAVDSEDGQAAVNMQVTTVQVYRPRPAMNQVVQPKNKKFAVMNTVITDVTVNNQTITISESKTNQGFFKGRRVDATTQF